MKPSSFLIAAAAGLVPAWPLSAQASLRLGGFAARYADSVDAQAGSVGLRLAAQSRRASGLFDASWSVFDSGSGAGQAWGSFVAIGPSNQRSALGLRTDGVFNGAQGGPWSATGSSELFAATLAGPWTLSAGIAVGAVRTVTGTSSPFGGPVVRARATLGFVTISAALANVNARGTRYSDASVTADWQRGRFSVGGLAASRYGDLGNGPWGQVYGGVALTDVLSFEASLGRYPADLAGYDHGRFANVGLRIRVSPPHESRALTADGAPDISPLSTLEPALRALLVEPLDSEHTRLTVQLDGAQTAAITGSWNDWTPLPLTALGGNHWTVVVPAGPGTWRFALIPDGGAWIVPEGVTRLPDDFGGEVGVLLIP